MAIYGAAHTDPDAMNYPTGTVPSIAAQLGQRYDNLVIKNLTLQTDPARKTEVKIGDMVYEATFLAKVDRTGLSSFAHFEFWRLEDAYHDLKSRPKTGDWLPYNNYPVLVEEGQVYKIDAAMVDGTRMTLFYRSDGALQNNLPVMEGFVGE